MRYEAGEPALWLRPWVRCAWTLRDDLGSGAAGRARDVERVFPDGCMELIFHLADPFDARTGEAPFERQPRGFLVGQIDRPLVLRPPPGARTIGITFRPAGASPFLGAPARQLTHRTVPLDELWGRAGRDLVERVLMARDPVAAITAVEETLKTRFDERHTPDAVLDVSLRVLGDSAGAAPIGALGRTLGIGERRLERLFAEHVGLAPKPFSRIVRLQHALTLARRSRPGRGTLADLAHEAGYADHPHFGRELRRLTGLRPTDLRAREEDLADLFIGRDGVGSVQDGPTSDR